MKRREFITLLGGAAAWPLAARAQQGERMRRIGVLMAAATQDDAIAQAQLAAFEQGLEKLGWIEGRNAHIETRLAGGDPDRIRSDAADLIALGPDVILAQTTLGVEAVVRENRSIPIVFLQINDPVGTGLVANLAHPGGNITGFTPAEFSMGSKMLEVLKDVAPQTNRVAVVLNQEQLPGVMTWRAIEAAAKSIAIRTTATGVRNAADIERAFDAFAGESNLGLIVLASAPTIVHRKTIIELAAQRRLPAVYTYPFFVREGGLISYGVELKDQYRQAASYVDRILKGTKPGDLPVQQPTRFELIINLKTAKALGLDIPLHLQQLADEVIE